MADSAGRVGQFTDEMEQAASEVAEDVKDSVGAAIEQGVQAVIGPKLTTPQQIQQRKLEDQKKMVWARNVINRYKKIDQEQKNIRMQDKQKQMQKQKEQAEDTQDKKVEKIKMQQGTKKPGQSLREDIARSRQEIGKGHGVGG